MRILNTRYYLVLFAFLLTVAGSAHSKTRITIIDQNNQPLPNAVIEYSVQPLDQIPFSPPAEETIYIMDQVNKQFEPHVLIIPEDSLVSFPNSDDIRHHVYSFSPAKTFELKLYAGKPKNPLRFNKSGVVVMGCNIHDSMVGYIYVSSSSHALISGANGEVVFPQDLTKETELNIWHPNSSIGISKHKTFTLNQTMLNKGNIVLKMTVNEPEIRDSFETLNVHEY